MMGYLAGLAMTTTFSVLLTLFDDTWGPVWIGVIVGVGTTLLGFFINAWWQHREERKKQRWPFEKYNSFTKLLERPDLKAEIPHAPRTTVDLPEDPPPALLITGPAGVGKTREALEWLRRLEDQNEPGQVQFLVPRSLGRYQHPENLEIPGDLRARNVVIFLDSLETYSHSDTSSMKAFEATRSALQQHLPHTQVTLLATIRERLRSRLAPGSPWSTEAALERELSWLNADESAALTRKCVEHYKLAVEENFAENLGKIADGQAVSLVGFFREQKGGQATPLGEEATNQYMETWQGKELKPLLDDLTLDAKKTLAALGYLIEQALPPTPILHAAVHRSFYEPSLGGQLRAFFSRRRGRNELRDAGLLEETSEALSPYHDLLAETSYLGLSEAGNLPALDPSERWLRLVEDLTSRFSVWLARIWGPRRRTHLTSLIALTNQALTSRDVQQRTQIRLYSSIIVLAKRARGKRTQAVALANWGNVLQNLAQAIFADDPHTAKKLYQQACDKFRQATDIKPDFHEAWNNWGGALLNLAQAEEDSDRSQQLRETAIEKTHKAISIHADCTYLDNLGLILEEDGRRDKALSARWAAARCYLSNRDLSGWTTQLRLAWDEREQAAEALDLAWGAGLAAAMGFRLEDTSSTDTAVALLTELQEAPPEARNPLWDVAFIYARDGELPEEIPSVAEDADVVEQHLEELLTMASDQSRQSREP